MNAQLRPGTYRARLRAQQDDMITGKPVLKFYFDIADADGDCDAWICWCDDLLKNGEPSANLKGLRALGVTDAHLQEWARTGNLVVDPRDVDVVVEENKNGYSFVKYVNDRMRAAQPLDARQRQSVAAKMIQSLRGGQPSSVRDEPHMRAQAKAAEKAQAKAYAQAAAHPNAPGNDDDVPF